ncbi:hypothetical protein Psfp_03828 [Pelotomaculum sp. FP]|nr:hypothetical protein Psfp_03828 [Pelotomaculum sp. FP]
MKASLRLSRLSATFLGSRVQVEVYGHLLNKTRFIVYQISRNYDHKSNILILIEPLMIAGILPMSLILFILLQLVIRWTEHLTHLQLVDGKRQITKCI